MAGTDSEIQEQDADEKKDRDYRTLMGAVAGALVILLFACLLWWLLSQRAEVPDVTGMDEDRARSVIEAAGFRVGDVATQTALPDEAGTILDQEPDGGRRALKGSDIDLVVAGAFAIGGPSDQTIDRGGPDTGDAGITLPPAGGDGVEAPDVDYYVAPENLGPQVPNVQGMTEAAARSTLTAAGYGAAVNSGAVSTDVGTGQVYYQEPAPGEYHPRGTIVTIWLATAESPGGYELPNE